jgi:ATP-dependent protease ClpP protease subunit
MAVTVNGTEITLTGDVGDYWFSDCITQTAVVEALAEVGRETDITVHLNSGGGVATEGAAIHATLAAHKGRVELIVEGWAASAASLIAMAADTVKMAKGSVMMIHDPSGLAWGTSDALRKGAEALDALGDAYAGVYADRCGMKPKDVRDIMKAETWYRPEEAVAAGFADAVLDSESPEPTAFSGIRAYARVPKEIVAKARGWNSRATMAALPAATGQKEIDMTEKTEADELAAEEIEKKAKAEAEAKAKAEAEAAALAAKPADPAAIAEACQTAGFPVLTAALLKSPVTMADVEVRIATAKTITEVAKTVGVPAMAGDLITMGASEEDARKVLFGAKAAKDEANPNDTANGSAPQAASWTKVIDRINARQ